MSPFSAAIGPRRGRNRQIELARGQAGGYDSGLAIMGSLPLTLREIADPGPRSLKGMFKAPMFAEVQA